MIPVRIDCRNLERNTSNAPNRCNCTLTSDLDRWKTSFGPQGQLPGDHKTTMGKKEYALFEYSMIRVQLIPWEDFGGYASQSTLVQIKDRIDDIADLLLHSIADERCWVTQYWVHPLGIRRSALQNDLLTGDSGPTWSKVQLIRTVSQISNSIIVLDPLLAKGPQSPS